MALFRFLIQKTRSNIDLIRIMVKEGGNALVKVKAVMDQKTADLGIADKIADEKQRSKIGNMFTKKSGIGALQELIRYIAIPYNLGAEKKGIAIPDDDEKKQNEDVDELQIAAESFTVCFVRTRNLKF